MFPAWSPTRWTCCARTGKIESSLPLPGSSVSASAPCGRGKARRMLSARGVGRGIFRSWWGYCDKINLTFKSKKAPSVSRFEPPWALFWRTLSYFSYAGFAASNCRKASPFSPIRALEGAAFTLSCLNFRHLWQSLSYTSKNYPCGNVPGCLSHHRCDPHR